MMTRGRGGGVWIPPKIDDVIYEQPLTRMVIMMVMMMEEDLGDEGDYDYPENGDNPKHPEDKDEYATNYCAGRILFVLRPTWHHCPTRSHK